jgi:hypothetical protein
VCLLLALPAGAHHSGAAFDRDKTVTVIGTVNSVEWTSPHARLKVDSKDEVGAAVTWDFELPSPVTVTGAPAREHAHIAIATGVTDKSGKRLFAGAASSTE